jgi:hypothetical protein
VQFILGVCVFVVVIGLIDAKLPWPDPRSKHGRSQAQLPDFTASESVGRQPLDKA